MVEARAEHQRTPQRLLDGVNIINRREGGLIEAYVPISQVYTEDVPVDLGHVRELAESIANESKSNSRTGQLSPVLLGQVDDFEKFPIIDGFHRVPALKTLGKQEVFATIRPNSTWEEVIDLRILAAATHRSVRFSRLIDWVEEAWQYSQWADKIRASQAFQLRFIRGMTGQRIGLKPEEVSEVKGWVDKKCEQWHVSAPVIYRNLTVARVADPELVKEVRERKSGYKLEAITPQHLQVIANANPNRYEIQRLVADAAKAGGLTVPRTRALSVLVSQAESIEEAKKIIESGSWITIEPLYAPKKKGVEIKPLGKEGQNYQELVGKFFDAEMEIARLTIENAILAGRYSPNIDEGKQVVAARLARVIENVSTDELEELQLEPVSPMSSDERSEVFEMINGMRKELISYLQNQFDVKPDNSEDIVQDAILKIVSYSNRGKLGTEYLERSRLKPLMLKAVQYTRVDWMRKALGRHTPHPFQASLSELEDNKRDWNTLKYDEPGYEEIEDEKELLRQNLRYVLPQLTDRQRRIVMMRAFYNLQSQDIAQILGEENPNTINSIYSQTRTKLAKLLTVPSSPSF